MAGKSGAIGVMLRIAFRNLWASRIRSAIIGGIVALGAFLVVVAMAVIGTINQGMKDSIQKSVGGHLQVYAAASEDELELYGGLRGESRLEPIEDFSRVKAALSKIPNVQSVVPMGIDQAMVATGNSVDIALERLRSDVRALEADGDDPARRASYQAHLGHVRRVVRLLREDLGKARDIVDLTGKEAAERQREWEDLLHADADAFWDGFDRDRYGHLEFLENRIAKLSLENGFTFIRYVGTDVAAYFAAFPLAAVAEGEMIPPGRRGVLIGKQYAEEWLKLKNARRLDRIKEARDRWKRRIATDEELQRWVKENGIGTQEILLRLDPVNAGEVTGALRAGMGPEAAGEELPALLARLFRTDDADFDLKHRLFYEVIAPRIRLYAINVGDTITIKAPSKSGYFNSVNVKVYGYLAYRGIERSGIAGMMSVLDLVSYRQLYGHMTRERADEIAAMKASVAVREVSRESAEEALFGGGGSLESVSRQSAIAEDRYLGGAGGPAPAEDGGRVYTQEELDRGVALNAALVLHDPARLAETMAEVKRISDEQKLGLKVADWEKASGVVGDFVSTLRIGISVALAVIFAVALVIVNNAIGMAALQRVKEIGTMRAIGAQRRFVLAMLLVESVTLGAVFGLLGAGLGGLAIRGIRAGGGIPAESDMASFLFAGPALLPQLTPAGTAWSLVIVVLVSVLSGLYPARLAMGVTPIEAMSSED